MKIATILDQIDLGSMALPEFQRGYVWNREQVRGLMQSLYRSHPVGSLLIWVTRTEDAQTRGDATVPPGTVRLLLDGQQRVTTLYGIVRGRPPEFFDGNAQSFTGLHFNLESEAFEFYSPIKMKDDPLWIDVTELMNHGVGEFAKRLVLDPKLAENLNVYLERVNAVDAIKSVDLHIEEVTGDDKTVDVVVDIFNRVNSGGTKLRAGDLALAKLCAAWPEARAAMKERLAKWKKAGFDFRLEWLLRCITAVLTGQARFVGLKDVRASEFRDALIVTERHIDRLLDLIASRLGLDHDRVLGSVYSLPVAARYLELRGGKITDHGERDELLFWYIHTMLWGRYSASMESTIGRDLTLIENATDGLGELVEELRQNRGDLTITARDFHSWSRGSRFYPLLYLLTRVHGAVDWEQGVELRGNLLGRLSSLQLHHIFPKALLYEHGYRKSLVNALANFTFLTQETNLVVSNRPPAEYLAEYAKKDRNAIESHWIPTDPELWKMENYEAFLEERQRLLAGAANEFLNELRSGDVPEADVAPSVLERDVAEVPGGFATEEEERIVDECNGWIVRQGLTSGECLFVLADPETGDVLAILDLAWPDGLQEGLSEPVALLIDEEDDVLALASRSGFRCFTSVDDLKEYVRDEVLVESAA